MKDVTQQMLTDTFYLCVSWILYYTSHSILATTKAKTYFSFIGAYYRFAYSSISILLLIPLSIFHHQLNTPSLIKTSTLFTVIAYFGIVIGLVLQWQTFKGYSTAEFLGYQAFTRVKEKEHTLFITGMNKYVRHPIYFSLLIILLSFLIVSPSFHNFAFVGISISYLFIGSYFEEKKLKQQFGQTYINYSKKVKRIIPFII